MVEICRLLHGKGLVAGRDGNLSARADGETLLVTPSGRNKGRLTSEDLLETDLEGNPLRGGKVTSEIGLHTFVYRRRPDVGAVIHTHATYCTAFALREQGFPDDLLIETSVSLGPVGLAAFAVPGTPEMAASLEPWVDRCDVVLLSHHGVCTFGTDLWEAYDRLEAAENAAKTMLAALTAGGVKRLAPGIRALLRKK